MVAARPRTEKAFRNRDIAQWSKLKRGVELSEAQLHLKEQLQNKKKLQLQLNLSPPSTNNSVEDDIARPPVQHANRSTNHEDSRNPFLSPECAKALDNALLCFLSHQTEVATSSTCMSSLTTHLQAAEVHPSLKQDAEVKKISEET